MLKLDLIHEAPKALLHDHLDGGLRPATVVELAAEIGYSELPTADPAELAQWFLRGADRKSLELYLEGFQHTIALLQTRDAIERVAAECAEDLAADNVVYAEVRYAPELSTEAGLTLDEVVTAILAGFREGEHRARLKGQRIVVKLLDGDEGDPGHPGMGAQDRGAAARAQDLRDLRPVLGRVGRER